MNNFWMQCLHKNIGFMTFPTKKITRQAKINYSSQTASPMKDVLANGSKEIVFLAIKLLDSSNALFVTIIGSLPIQSKNINRPARIANNNACQPFFGRIIQKITKNRIYFCKTMEDLTGRTFVRLAKRENVSSLSKKVNQRRLITWLERQKLIDSLCLYLI